MVLAPVMVNPILHDALPIWIRIRKPVVPNYCCVLSSTFLDSKVVIQQRYVQMTFGNLITITIQRIAMNMNIDNTFISLQQPNFSWLPILPTH